MYVCFFCKKYIQHIQELCKTLCGRRPGPAQDRPKPGAARSRAGPGRVDGRSVFCIGLIYLESISAVFL